MSVAVISDPQPYDDWHDDDGPVLWWRFPVTEPPYCGNPLHDDWPFGEEDEPHLWWQPIHGNEVHNAIARKLGEPEVDE